MFLLAFPFEAQIILPVTAFFPLKHLFPRYFLLWMFVSTALQMFTARIDMYFFQI